MKDSLKNTLSQIDIKQFQHDLISWFIEEQRDLPWRKDADPYKVWVSEIMLQQTKVDTVIPYFDRFLKKFPTIESFAAADDEAVLKIWEGLGYYSRVRNLHSAVKEVVGNYGGVVPDTQEEISKLKGVGPYTAGAVLSIAYGKPEPAVDGNVMRVLSRIMLIREDIAKASTRKVFEAAVRELIDHEHPSFFNQALMELGALICTPTSPACLLCPVRDHCLAFEDGVQSELPIKSRKKKTRHVDLIATVLKNNKEEFLIRKRPNKGLLAGLWEFPNVERNIHFEQSKAALQAYLIQDLQLETKLENGAFVRVDHVFTHLTWTIDAFAGELNPNIEIGQEYKLVTKDALEEYAFPVSHQKIWQAYKKQFA
ncbi:A/G-specific adenine glycosylase [Lederbergia lenta]|uniref:Adenine DNA glycosylase n=1 Tax=Lederbergia lenta TaxID=1467 RepID=A0A2X4WAJ5_LEDLE|nr:A/G-specific adenine glycosylase [Lederbergia lenta]MCM3113376.1 A/G-specific adenine glycosylase [Lederbergia lenta]MEC2326479.1 A/G-specific adenine glycosylase [Lederbergia lenta]SQI61196.1 A/G-specific adenine glycosylase [Lederbergia lenta]